MTTIQYSNNANKYKTFGVEGKLLEETFIVQIDGEPVLIKDVLTAYRNYATQREANVRKVQRRRLRQKEAKLREQQEQ